MPPSLSPTVAAAIARFRAALERRFGARLREIVLFGSHARGAAHEESDVDLFVVIDDVTAEERVAVVDLAYDADAAEGEPGAWVGLSPLVQSTAHAADMRARERLLLRDIDREGIAV